MSRYALEWAKEQQPGDAAAKALLLVAADHSDGPRHASRFATPALRGMASLGEEEYQRAVGLLVSQHLVTVGEFRKAHYTDLQLLIPDRWMPPRATRRPAVGEDIGEPRYVYKLYDSDGGLLYVGIARWPETRLDQHSWRQPWWFSVATRELTWYENRHLAAAEEYRAIQSERPRYNIALAPKDGESESAAPRRRYRILNGRRDAFGEAIARLRADLRAGVWDVGFLPGSRDLAERYGIKADLAVQVRDRLLNLGELATVKHPDRSVAYYRPWGEW